MSVGEVLDEQVFGRYQCRHCGAIFNSKGIPIRA